MLAIELLGIIKYELKNINRIKYKKLYIKKLDKEKRNRLLQINSCRIVDDLCITF